MAAIETGTTCIYGVAGTVTNLFVQSYSLSASFNAEATVADETGITKTARYDDRKSEITIDGIAKTSAMPVLGDAISLSRSTPLQPTQAARPPPPLSVPSRRLTTRAPTRASRLSRSRRSTTKASLPD
jgi:hypothetical protein